MENILVAIDSKRGAWEAISHACSLAKRVDVRINVLLVLSGVRDPISQAETVILKQMKKRIDLHIEAAKTEGLTINYFIAEGDYEDEVIDFIKQHKISLFVCQKNYGEKRSIDREMASLRSLQHRIACRMEIVVPKRKNLNE